MPSPEVAVPSVAFTISRMFASSLVNPELKLCFVEEDNRAKVPVSLPYTINVIVSESASVEVTFSVKLVLVVFPNTLTDELRNEGITTGVFATLSVCIPVLPQLFEVSFAHHL